MAAPEFPAEQFEALKRELLGSAVGRHLTLADREDAFQEAMGDLAGDPDAVWPPPRDRSFRAYRDAIVDIFRRRNRHKEVPAALVDRLEDIDPDLQPAGGEISAQDKVELREIAGRLRHLLGDEGAAYVLLDAADSTEAEIAAALPQTSPGAMRKHVVRRRPMLKNLFPDRN